MRLILCKASPTDVYLSEERRKHSIYYCIQRLFFNCRKRQTNKGHNPTPQKKYEFKDFGESSYYLGIKIDKMIKENFVLNQRREARRNR